MTWSKAEPRRTMFILFTNDVVSHIQFGRLFSHADDSQLVYWAKPDDLSELKRDIEDDLDQLSRYFHGNGLKVRPSF